MRQTCIFPRKFAKCGHSNASTDDCAPQAGGLFPEFCGSAETKSGERSERESTKRPAEEAHKESRFGVWSTNTHNMSDVAERNQRNNHESSGAMIRLTNKESSPESKKARKSSSFKLTSPPYLLHDRSNNGNNAVKGFAAVAELLKGRKNILVLTGAGLSVSCGIPDFRSQNGLYATLDPEELGLHAAEELFDNDVFAENPKPFYKFARQHFFPQDNGSSESKTIKPSFAHYFLAMLQQHSQLLRVYTQNIDGLEELAGGKTIKAITFCFDSITFPY